MNILIVGEFSGFARHLRNGFETLGHKVVVVLDGDSFKKIPHSSDDILYESRDLKFLGHHIPMSNVLFSRKVNQFIKSRLNSLNIQFDLIVIICDQFVSNSTLTIGVPIQYIEKQSENGAKVIFTSCGSDAAYLIFRKELWYYDKAFPRTLRNSFIEKPSKEKIDRLNRILRITDCVIPTTYDYYLTMNRYLESYYKKPLKVCYLPLPISESTCTINSCVGRKILLFHGVIRPIPKGTPFITEALRRIETDYPDKVEVVIKGNMPYQEYLTLFDKIDILLDQTNGYGSGMNANIGLMSGKVVLSNNEPEEEKIRGFKSPVINIRPDANQIYNALKTLIDNPLSIDKIRFESRKYAMTFLKSDIIAKSYLDYV